MDIFTIVLSVFVFFGANFSTSDLCVITHADEKSIELVCENELMNSWNKYNFDKNKVIFVKTKGKLI